MSKASVIAEIRTLIGKTEVGPNDITLDEIASGLSISNQAARDRMAPLIEDGIFGTALKFSSTLRRDVRVYWKILTPLTDTAFDGMMEERSEDENEL